MPGLAFPPSDTYLTYFGCDDLYHARQPVARRSRIDRGVGPARQPQLRAARCPAPAPPPARSTLIELDRRHHRRELRRARRVRAAAASPTSGTSPPSSAGRGVGRPRRPDRRRGAGSRSTPPPRSYTWSCVDRRDRRRSSATAAPRRIADFTDEHGDGPGYLLAGFGCDGAEFSIDRLRYGSPGDGDDVRPRGDRRHGEDAASLAQAKVAAGDPVTITGRAVDGTGAPIGASMVLQAKPAGARAGSRRSATPSPSRPTAWSARSVHPEDVDRSTAGTSPPSATPTTTWSTTVTVTVDGDEPAAAHRARRAAEPTPRATGPPDIAPTATRWRCRRCRHPPPSADPAAEPSEPSPRADRRTPTPTEQPTETPSAPQTTEPTRRPRLSALSPPPDSPEV